MDLPHGSLSTASQSPTSLLDTIFSAATTATAAETESPLPIIDSDSTSWLALLGQILVTMARGMSGLLIWIITFTTITLPTLLFALFSTSLTFTMNFTTLYVEPGKR